jgi:hypothetical protein
MKERLGESAPLHEGRPESPHGTSIVDQKHGRSEDIVLSLNLGPRRGLISERSTLSREDKVRIGRRCAVTGRPAVLDLEQWSFNDYPKLSPRKECDNHNFLVWGRIRL